MQGSAVVLPERIADPDGLLLRRWTVDDAESLSQAVAESVGHLRPWMGWIAQEPLSLRQRYAAIKEWERDWAQGGDVLLGVFLGERIAGGCGLHRRLGANGLELGYWIHPHFLRRGMATQAARLLTGSALLVPGITHVEIHHDKANEASQGVPRKLGFQLLGEWPDKPEGPSEIGIECRWRMDKATWLGRSSTSWKG